MMIVTCEKCKTNYRLKADSRRPMKFKARCSKCDHVFLVSKTAAQVETAPPIEPQPDVPGASRDRRRQESNCRVITICNQKGGVAKTTTCMNLGASLRLMGKRVLLIDFDVQANLSLLLGYRDASSFFEVIHSDAGELARHIVKTEHDLFLLPSNSKMALLSKKHLRDENFEYMLRDKLWPAKQQFDYILIDTPPSGDFYTLNALLASDVAAIPAPCEYLSMNGVSHIKGMIDVIREKTDHQIDYRVLVTKFDPNDTACRVILSKLHEQHDGKVFKTMIEKDEKILESQIVHAPVLFYCKDSRAGLQYKSLAEEIVVMQSGATDSIYKEAYG